MSASFETAITFRCADQDLVGILHGSGASRRPVGVLIVIGGPQYRIGSHRQFVLMGRQLAAAGFPVLRFDYGGMGDSTGSQKTFESIDDDIRAAMVAFRNANPQLNRIVVLGLCDAASAALMYCGAHTDVCGLILINPWVRTEEGSARVMVRHYYAGRLFQRSLWQKIFARQFKPTASLKEALVFAQRAWRSRGRGETSSRQTFHPFLERMETGLSRFSGPILLVLSGRDLTAREFEDFCSRSPTWAGWCASPQVSRLMLDEADHTFSAALSLRKASDNILSWLQAVERDCPRASGRTESRGAAPFKGL